MNEEAKALVAMVAWHAGVSYGAIMGMHKQQRFVRARDVAVLLVRRRLGLTYPALARIFNRSSSAIKNSTHRAMNRKDAQETIREILEKL